MDEDEMPENAQLVLMFMYAKKLEDYLKLLLEYDDLSGELIHKEGCKFPCKCGLTKLLADIKFSLK